MNSTASLGQDAEKQNGTSVLFSSGASYTGWNAELGVSRSLNRFDLGLLGRYIFGGNTSGVDGVFGFSILATYDLVQADKVSVFVGPSFGWVWTEVPRMDELNRYLEVYANLGAYHQVSRSISIGYMVGYGGVVSSLFDRFDDNRYTTVTQAGTLKLLLTYAL